MHTISPISFFDQVVLCIQYLILWSGGILQTICHPLVRWCYAYKISHLTLWPGGVVRTISHIPHICQGCYAYNISHLNLWPGEVFCIKYLLLLVCDCVTLPCSSFQFQGRRKQHLNDLPVQLLPVTKHLTVHKVPLITFPCPTG